MGDVFGKRYFTHDFDASHDPKCMALVLSEGPASYGRWWMLVECMGRSSNGFIDLLEPGQTAVLQAELRLDMEPVTDLQTFLKTLAMYKLIDDEALERGHVMSATFIKRQEYLTSKAAAGSKGGKSKTKQVLEAGA